MASLIRFVARVAVLAAFASALAAGAATLRWSNRGDVQTADPHSQNEGLTNNINGLIDQFLVDSDRR